MADEKMMMNETATESTATPDALEKELTNFGATPEVVAAIKDFGVANVEDLVLLNESELREAGMNVIQARKLLESLKPKPTEDPKTETTAPTGPAVSAVFSADSILPTVPPDDSWLSILKTGGVLKVDQATYIAAIRAALADRTKIYDVPKKLVDALESYAYEADEPVSPEFYKLMKQLTRRSYGDLFAAIDGVDGNFVSEKRKKALLDRINAHLWPAVANCYQQLNAWQQAWVNGFNPTILMANYMGGGAPLPPGMAQVPDTSPLQDASDDLRNALNRSLAGTGSVVASAMAYDYRQIKEVLQDPSLPAKVGAANREQMYKRLGLAVDASMIRAEVSIVRFIMSFVQADNVTPDAAAGYYSALFVLGSQINWEQLGLKTQSHGGIRNLGGDQL